MKEEMHCFHKYNFRPFGYDVYFTKTIQEKYKMEYNWRYYLVKKEKSKSKKENELIRGVKKIGNPTNSDYPTQTVKVGLSYNLENWRKNWVR